MRITTRAVYDIASWTLEDWAGYEYCGPVEECKGGDVAKAQMDQQNKITADQLAQQKAIRDKILSSTEKYTTGAGEGYDPAQFAAMISQFLNQNSATFNAARGQVISSLNTRGVGGGEAPGGGDTTRGLENLEGARATSQSQGILGANISNLEQAITNRFNAFNVQGGQAAQVGSNIGTFNAGANEALGDYIKAKNAPGFMQSLGQTLSAGVGGGIANMIGKVPIFKPAAKPA